MSWDTMHRTTRRLAGVVLALAMTAPVLAGLAQAQGSSPVADTVWPPADCQEAKDLPAFLETSLNLSETRATGVQPFDGYRINPINATHAELRLVDASGDPVQTIVLQHEPVGNETNRLRFKAEHLDRPWVSITRSPESGSIIGFEALFPPGSVNVTPDEEGPPLMETAEAFSQAVGLSQEALPHKRIDWTLSQMPSDDYKQYVNRSVDPMGFPEGCWEDSPASCSGSVVTQMSCHCATVTGRVQPPAGQQLTDSSDGEILVGVPTYSGRVDVTLNEDREVIGASFLGWSLASMNS
jgi:hypothetical protein